MPRPSAVSVLFSGLRSRRGSGLALQCAAALVLLGSPARADDGPRSLDPRVRIELYAENPQIVTPTGLDVDRRGRVFALESNTHFPPQQYTGHPTDRLLVLEDRDQDGRAEQVETFADGFRHAMSVLVIPSWQEQRVGLKSTEGRTGTAVLVATRRAIWLLHDDTGDARSDRQTEIVTLETKGDYPHNGLAGFALDALNWLYFGFGENLGESYTLRGSDGRSLSGGGEGGNIYRCRLDGSSLEQVSTGYWNPHASALDGLGRLFTVDNDPDSRPPCRLMHVTPGSDFGYRFRNGRKGLHPFTAWNGELPGTLPMTAGTGEAPSGIVACEAGGWPEEFAGNLLVTSWGDHRIDRFVLKPRGSSFQSLAEPLITGGADFRPVGLAWGPDGSLYCTDWVLQDYTLHQRGRIWRISATPPAAMAAVDLTTLEAAPPDVLEQRLHDTRLPVRRAAARALASSAEGVGELLRTMRQGDLPLRTRHEAFWAWLQSEAAQPLAADQLDQLLKPDSGLARAVAEQLGAPRLPDSGERALRLAKLLINERLGGRSTPGFDQTALLPALAHATAKGNNLIGIAMSVDDPYVLGAMIDLMTRDLSSDELAALLTPGSMRSARTKTAALLAARRKSPRDETIALLGLADRDPRVRQAAVQWVAEERLTALRPDVEAVFQSGAVTSELFLATLAALEMLDGANPADIDRTPASQYVLPLVKDAGRPVGVRQQALRLVAPRDAVLTPELFESLWSSGDAALRREALRTWQTARGETIQPRILELVGDPLADASLRLEGVVALAGLVAQQPGDGPARRKLAGLIQLENPAIAVEALRGVRGLREGDPATDAAVESLAERLGRTIGRPSEAEEEVLAQLSLVYEAWKREIPAKIAPLLEKRPQTREEWISALGRGKGGDPEAGRRVFYHPGGPGCVKCHTIDGRGGRVGPELSRVVDTMNRLQLMQSILDPSGEIAPQFVAWTMETREGKTVTGMIVHENEGKTILGNADGETIELKTTEIVDRVPQKTSVMPEKLVDRMTVKEVRDILAFLEKGSS